MSAIRLARAATGRKIIVKFEGCYHGHSDALLVKAGSGVATLGIPGSAGVPEEFVEFTLALPYNNVAAVEAAFGKFKDQIACVIVEPVVGNMGCVPPQAGYLAGSARDHQREGALLHLRRGDDRVPRGVRRRFGALRTSSPTSRRWARSSAAACRWALMAARRSSWTWSRPLGPVYQAGTLSGNPLAMAAGIATLCQLKANREQFYKQLDEMAGKLVAGITAAAKEAGVAMTANRVGSMFTFFFTDKQVTDWESAATCDTARFGRFHGAHARRRSVAAALTVRSGVPQHRAHARRHRRYASPRPEKRWRWSRNSRARQKQSRALHFSRVGVTSSSNRCWLAGSSAVKTTVGLPTGGHDRRPYLHLPDGRRRVRRGCAPPRKSRR